MSHEVETMAFANEVPWHGLGARVSGDVTPDEMLKAAGLDWEIKRESIYAKVNGAEVRIPGRKAMIRSTDNKVMTIAGQDWKPLQNRDLLGFFKDYSESGGATLETAGSLRGGSIVWALADLKDGFKVGRNDRVNGYLLFTSPHKVGSAITVRTTTVRVVCANTMAMAEAGGVVNYKQNHLSHFDVTAARTAIENAHASLAAASKRAASMHKLKLSIRDRLRFLAPFFADDGMKDADLMEMASAEKDSKLKLVNTSIEKAPGAEPDTAWGILQGVLHWGDHVNGRNASTRMFRSWVGDISKTKIEVEAALMEMAG